MKNQIEVVENENEGEAGKKRRKVEIPYALNLDVSLTESLHEDTCVENEDDIDEKVGGDKGDDDEEWVTFGRPPTGQTRMNCPLFVAACDRFGIGNRSASVSATSILKDISEYVPQVKSLIFDKSKIYRERTETRETLQNEELAPAWKMKAIYFDGRKDQTKVVEEADDGILWQMSTIEDQITLIQKPGGSYLGHVSPLSSDAESFLNAILDFCY